MKILIWATSFAADLWSFTKYVSTKEDATVKVMLADPRKSRSEVVSELFPLNVAMYGKNRITTRIGIPFFRPDVMIADNNIPRNRLAPKCFMLWHGFGWKGPNDRKEFSGFHEEVKEKWGDYQKPNKNFRWQCFGPWDFKHRTEVSGIHPDNCRTLGAASHDDLRTPLDKRKVAHGYPFDIVGKKTVLIAPTWHYGQLFSHWGKDKILLRRLFSYISQKGMNIIFRLHDSYRFAGEYIHLLHDLEKEYPNLMLKYKDKNLDNYVDMQIADILITNFSSIANLFYATKKPVIHVYPVKSKDEEFMWLRIDGGILKKKKVDSVKYIWKLPPEENGGFLAKEFDQIISMLDTALEDSRCCAKKSQEFLDEYMLGADGKSCDRIWEALNEFVYEKII